jgi:hypothetical protein
METGGTQPHKNNNMNKYKNNTGRRHKKSDIQQFRRSAAQRNAKAPTALIPALELRSLVAAMVD